MFPIIICLLTSTSLMFMSSHWFPPWSHVILPVDYVYFMFFHVFSYYPMLSSYPPQVSSLISLFFSCYLPWSLCSSHVSFIMILMMIAIKSIWWCPPPVIICSLMMFSACFISLIWLSWLIADYFYLKYLAMMTFISLILVCYILKICFNRGL